MLRGDRMFKSIDDWECLNHGGPLAIFLGHVYCRNNPIIVGANRVVAPEDQCGLVMTIEEARWVAGSDTHYSILHSGHIIVNRALVPAPSADRWHMFGGNVHEADLLGLDRRDEPGECWVTVVCGPVRNDGELDVADPGERIRAGIAVAMRAPRLAWLGTWDHEPDTGECEEAESQYLQRLHMGLSEGSDQDG